MKLVIEIPDHIYLDIKNDYFPDEREMVVLSKSIFNGTPLPKGHDVLIDHGELKKIIQENDPLSMTGFSVRLCDIYRATPIIPADKEEP